MVSETEARSADQVAPSARWEGDLPGSPIVAASWLTTGIFTVTAAGDRFGVDALEPVATGVALVFFAAGIVVWLVAFARAVGRSRTEEVTLGGLFFLVGTAPRPVRIQLLGSLVVAIVAAGATASEAPFGVMEPVLPLALAGLWGAGHGRFAPRKPRR